MAQETKGIPANPDCQRKAFSNTRVVRRLDTPRSPFPYDDAAPSWRQRENWPAQMVEVEGAGRHDGSSVTAYRLKFRCETRETFRALVTADQRYWLYLDGERIGEGSERGCLNEWFYETYEITLDAGEHSFWVLTWWLEKWRPRAQISIRPGFMLASPDIGFTERLSTGLADWEGRRVDGIQFLDPEEQLGQMCASGARLSFRGRSWATQFEDGSGGWTRPKPVRFGNNAFTQYASGDKWVFSPGRISPMRKSKVEGAKIALAVASANPTQAFDMALSDSELVESWSFALDRCASYEGEPTTLVPPRSSRTVLINLSDYVCGYSRIVVAGGAGSEVKVEWAERLSLQPDLAVSPKERGRVDGRFFVGMGDTFYPAGGGESILEPLWWLSGCWVRITARTAEDALAIRSIEFERTGYPLDNRSSFDCDDSILAALFPIAFRTLQSCAHETYMDCPYWEQLQYIADTRLQALLTYAATDEARLPRKALSIFRHSASGPSPLPASCFPANTLQIIAPFSLWWIEMLHDFAMWRGEPAFIRELMPLGWWIIDHFMILRREDGLVASTSGWNYLDSSFRGGEGPGSGPGQATGSLQWQCVLALDSLSRLADWLGEPERAAAASRRAEELAACAEKAFWDESRGALAEDIERTCFAEHSQALAVISGRLSTQVRERIGTALVQSEDLVRALPYFSHYVLEAYKRLGAGDRLVDRIGEWKQYLKLGFYTFPEHGVEGRSDCHAWNAHPSYHLLASVLGIRPDSFGFGTVVVEPLLGSLGRVSGSMPHPKGMIQVELERRGGALTGVVVLPEGLGGAFRWSDATFRLSEGRNEIDIQAG